eukprot:scaffold1671_cov36-Phaeocystis_antarctica.AAC.2
MAQGNAEENAATLGRCHGGRRSRLQRPARLLRASLWPREERLRRVDDEARLLRARAAAPFGRAAPAPCSLTHLPLTLTFWPCGACTFLYPHPNPNPGHFWPCGGHLQLVALALALPLTLTQGTSGRAAGTCSLYPSPSPAPDPNPNFLAPRRAPAACNPRTSRGRWRAWLGVRVRMKVEW